MEGDKNRAFRNIPSVIHLDFRISNMGNCLFCHSLQNTRFFTSRRTRRKTGKFVHNDIHTHTYAYGNIHTYTHVNRHTYNTWMDTNIHACDAYIREHLHRNVFNAKLWFSLCALRYFIFLNIFVYFDVCGLSESCFCSLEFNNPFPNRIRVYLIVSG